MHCEQHCRCSPYFFLFYLLHWWNCFTICAGATALPAATLLASQTRTVLCHSILTMCSSRLCLAFAKSPRVRSGALVTSSAACMEGVRGDVLLYMQDQHCTHARRCQENHPENEFRPLCMPLFSWSSCCGTRPGTSLTLGARQLWMPAKNSCTRTSGVATTPAATHDRTAPAGCGITPLPSTCITCIHAHSLRYVLCNFLQYTSICFVRCCAALAVAYHPQKQPIKQ
jgi:hypothetical protein